MRLNLKPKFKPTDKTATRFNTKSCGLLIVVDRLQIKKSIIITSKLQIHRVKPLSANPSLLRSRNYTEYKVYRVTGRGTGGKFRENRAQLIANRSQRADDSYAIVNCNNKDLRHSRSEKVKSRESVDIALSRLFVSRFLVISSAFFCLFAGLALRVFIYLW